MLAIFYFDCTWGCMYRWLSPLYCVLDRHGWLSFLIDDRKIKFMRWPSTPSKLFRWIKIFVILFALPWNCFNLFLLHMQELFHCGFNDWTQKCCSYCWMCKWRRRLTDIIIKSIYAIWRHDLRGLWLEKRSNCLFAIHLPIINNDLNYYDSNTPA